MALDTKAIGLVVINLSDVQLLERQANSLGRVDTGGKIYYTSPSKEAAE